MHPLLILVIKARTALEDRVAGLYGGADDVVLKPFAVPESPRGWTPRHDELRAPRAVVAAQAHLLAQATHTGERQQAAAARGAAGVEATGTDLGRAIVRRAALRLGGSVGLTPGPGGRGCGFVVT